MRGKAAFEPLTGNELRFIASLRSDQVSLPARADIIRPGQLGPALYTLFAGWGFRYRRVPGGGRQILEFLLPGDLIGLRLTLTGSTDHGARSLTGVSLCALHGRPLKDLFVHQPRLAEALTRTLRENWRQTQIHLAQLGRRPATQRLAFLLLHLFDRLRALDMAEEGWCHFPIQRRHLSDALGLSGPHISRCLVELRENGLLIHGNNALVIMDRAKLEGFASYQADRSPPRLLL